MENWAGTAAPKFIHVKGTHLSSTFWPVQKHVARSNTKQFQSAIDFYVWERGGLEAWVGSSQFCHSPHLDPLPSLFSVSVLYLRKPNEELCLSLELLRDKMKNSKIILETKVLALLLNGELQGMA